MKTEEKLSLALGTVLVVGGIASMIYLDHLANKAMTKRSEEFYELQLQLGWESIQNSRMFAEASSEERVKYFDTYWKTTGGRK